MHFLGLALADNVFTELSLSTLDDRRIPMSSNSRRFGIREGKKDMPILRMLTGGARKGKVLSASSLYHELKDLGQRCGYEKPISAYCFRRGFANGIDGTEFVRKAKT